MAETTTQAGITAEQYRTLQRPVNLPKPNEVFDFEVERLVSKRVATYAQADPFRKDVPSGLFLFMPLKPQEMDLNHLVSLIEVDGKRGVNYLAEQSLADEIEVPPAPYLALDVEDGDGRSGVKPSVNLANILAEHRSPGLTFEGIVHCFVFPEVLKHHFIDLVGSRYESEGRPSLYLNGGRPELHAYWNDDAIAGWGAWSCGSRRGLRG